MKHESLAHRFLRAVKAALFLSVVFLGIAAALTPMRSAQALLVDQTRIFNPRQTPDQQVSYYRLTINYNDQNIGSAQQFGALPANAYVLSVDAYVSTAFNAGTTNVVTLGTTKANSNEVLASGITAGTIGVYHLTSAAGLGLAVATGSAVPLFAKYAQTGTAATAGSVTIVVAFVSNNDL